MSYVEIKAMNHIDLDVDCYVIEVTEKVVPANYLTKSITKRLSDEQKQVWIDHRKIDISEVILLKGKKNSYILTCGPSWINGFHNEPKQLYLTYMNALNLAKQHHFHSIAFPLISCSSIGFPISGAFSRALRACKDFIDANSDYPITIHFGIKDEGMIKIGKKVLEDIKVPQKRQTQLDDYELYLLNQIQVEDLQDCIDALCHRFGKAKGCFALMDQVDYDANDVASLIKEKVASNLSAKEIQMVLSYIQKENLSDTMYNHRYLLKLMLRLDDLIQYLES